MLLTYDLDIEEWVHEPGTRLAPDRPKFKFGRFTEIEIQFCRGTTVVEINSGTSRTLATSSIAANSIITTSAPHGFVTGETVTIAGHTGSTPTINGDRVITVTGAYTFSIPVNVTVAGTGGTAVVAVESSIIGFKALNVYDGGFLASAESSLFTGSGATARYSFAPNFNTDPLETALLIDGNTANDVASLEANLEVMFILGTGRRLPTADLPVLLVNNVCKGSEGVPTTGSPVYPTASVLEEALVQLIWMRTGNKSRVDSVYGYAGGAEREGIPFLTLAGARAGSTAGDLITVGPGDYPITAALPVDEINWHFDAGTTVNFAHDVAPEGIFDDDGSLMVFTVTGHGIFSRTTDDDNLNFATIRSSHASSVITVDALDIIAVGGADGTDDAVNGTAGTLFVKARQILKTGGNGYAVWWGNGRMHVRADYISSTNFAVGAEVTATPTGDYFVEADEIYGADTAVVMYGTQATAAMWVRALIIRSQFRGSMLDGAGRLYVETQKLFGTIYNHTTATGLHYIRTLKQSAVANGSSGLASLIHCAAGTLRYEGQHLDPSTFTGEMIKVTGGTLILKNIDYTAGASAKGIEITGGTLRLINCRINTAANSSTNPIIVSGGTLIIEAGCVLVAEATRDSISAASAQIVLVYPGSCANKAVDGDITQLVSSLTISSSVA